MMPPIDPGLIKACRRIEEQQRKEAKRRHDRRKKGKINTKKESK